MKRITNLLVCIGLATTTAMAEKWVLTWSDEFNGDSIDRSKWGFEIGGNGWGNQELEYYTDRQENAFIDNGNLVIKAIKEQYEGMDYTSARMVTKGKFSTKYGRFEARAKLPYGQGIWPAFWLLGDDIDEVHWPACGEIDIMEQIGKHPKTVFGSLHAPQWDKSDGYTLESGFSDDFHVYSVNWQPGFIEFSVDGHVFSTAHKSEAGGDEHWPFDDRNFYILLNLAVGGAWPGNPDETTQFPQQLIFDYVRVYELDFDNQEFMK